MVCMQNICIWSICLYILHINYTLQEKILGQGETEDFDFDGIPGANHEFMFNVAGGYEECFFQNVPQGANLYMNFEVLQGGDRLLDVYVRDPDFITIDSHLSKSEGKFEKRAEKPGIYSLCFDNQYSRYQSRMVLFYLATFVRDDLNKYVKEVGDILGTVDNFTHSITGVQDAIQAVRIHQTTSRMNIVKDWYLIVGNNNYVMYWSILQCCIIFATYGMTTYFVRRLFRTPNVTPTAKPRA